MTQTEAAAPHRPPPSSPRRVTAWLLKLSAALLAGLLSLALTIAILLAVAFPQLPDISGLTDYRPRQPLRVWSADGELIGEFGEERRKYLPIQQIPAVMQQAVLAIEDSRFY